MVAGRIGDSARTLLYDAARVVYVWAPYWRVLVPKIAFVPRRHQPRVLQGLSSMVIAVDEDALSSMSVSDIAVCLEFAIQQCIKEMDIRCAALVGRGFDESLVSAAHDIEINSSLAERFNNISQVEWDLAIRESFSDDEIYRLGIDKAPRLADGEWTSGDFGLEPGLRMEEYVHALSEMNTHVEQQWMKECEAREDDSLAEASPPEGTPVDSADSPSPGEEDTPEATPGKECDDSLNAQEVDGSSHEQDSPQPPPENAPADSRDESIPDDSSTPGDTPGDIPDYNEDAAGVHDQPASQTTPDTPGEESNNNPATDSGTTPADTPGDNNSETGDIDDHDTTPDTPRRGTPAHDGENGDTGLNDATGDVPGTHSEDDRLSAVQEATDVFSRMEDFRHSRDVVTGKRTTATLDDFFYQDDPHTFTSLAQALKNIGAHTHPHSSMPQSDDDDDDAAIIPRMDIQKIMIDVARSAAESSGGVHTPGVYLDSRFSEWVGKVLTPPKVKWSKVLQKIAMPVMSGAMMSGDSDLSFSKRHPNQIDGQPVMPALVTYAPNVTVLIDASPSMARYADTTTAEFINATKAFFNRYGQPVTLAIADSEVRWAMMSTNPYKKALKEVQKTYHSSSYDFGDVIMRAAKKGVKFKNRTFAKPNVLVVITDGEFEWPWSDSKVLPTSVGKIIVVCTHTLEELGSLAPKWLNPQKNFVVAR